MIGDMRDAVRGGWRGSRERGSEGEGDRKQGRHGEWG